jgi:hypothetical protein
MELVFQGLESPSHRVTLRTLMASHPFTGVYGGISFKTLKARRLSARYVKDVVGDVPVVLEAGVSQSQMSETEALNFVEEYYSFVVSVPEVSHVIEFDHPSLSPKSRRLIADMRSADPRIIPIWQVDEGIPVLQELLTAGARRVGMGADTLKDRRVPAVLRGSRSDDSLVLVMGTSQLDDMDRVGATMVSNSTWLASASFGDFIFFDGRSMLRASSAERDHYVHQHAEQIAAAGFGVDLVKAGEAREVTRLAGWSMIEWAKHLSSNSTDSEGVEDETASAAPGKSLSRIETQPRSRTMLPVFGTDSLVSVETDEDGQSEIKERAVLTTRSDSVRMCDSCYLSGVCPAYQPAESCAYNFPVEVRTPAQMRALLHSVLELQASRVAFAKFAEDVNGGYPDEVVSKEMDRLFVMAEKLKKVEERRERITVSVEHEESGPPSESAGGVLSAIFGRSVPQPPAIETDVMIAQVIEE